MSFNFFLKKIEILYLRTQYEQNEAMRIELDHFRELYRKIFDEFSKKYKEKYGESPTETQAFGQYGHNSNFDTLASSMYKHDEIIKFMSKERKKGKTDEQIAITAGYLYKKKGRIEKDLRGSGSKEKTVSINSPYSTILFLYLGHKNYNEYKARREASNVVYDGYYYSYIKHQVCSYELRINYDVKPNFPGVPHQEYSVSEKGYHDNSNAPTYKGYGYIKTKKLQLILNDEKREDHLRIFLESGDNPQANKHMRGVIAAVASYNPNPITVTETVLIKRVTGVTNIRDQLSTKRYLLLHQNNFRINTGTMNLKMMESKRVSVDIMVPFVGIWKTYRFGKTQKEIIRSYLWVKEDYRISCFTSAYPDLPNFQEQVCLPDMTTYDLLNTRTINIRSYPSLGANIVSSSMINIPNKSDLNIEGVISFVGQNRERPMARGLLLIRDEKLTDLAGDLNDDRERNMSKQIKETLEKEVNIVFTDTSDIPLLLLQIEKRLLLPSC